MTACGGNRNVRFGAITSISGHSLFVRTTAATHRNLSRLSGCRLLNKLPFIGTGEDGNQDLYFRVTGPALTLRPVKVLGTMSRSSTEQLRPKGKANASGDLPLRGGELRH
jgi:hypothetical protein